LLLAPHSSYRITPYINAAEKLGVDVLIASTSEYSLVSAVADGLRIDLNQPDRAVALIVEAARQHPFSGVIATDDTAVTLAARAAEALGLAHNVPESVRLTQRKDFARQRLFEHGLPVPTFRRIDLAADLLPQAQALEYPCVIKPLSLSGSRGVIRVDSAADCVHACKRIGNIVRELPDIEEQRYLLAEAYLPGAEVAVEAMLTNGKLQLLSIFDKPDPLEGPFFEETYYITPSRLSPAMQQHITRRVSEACTAYGLRTGPVHAELRIHNGEAWILEVAARTIGGQCARLLRHGTGYGLEEWVIAHAVGRPLPPQPQDRAAGVLMIPVPQAGVLRRVEGLPAARRITYVTDVEISVREGYELVPLPEGSAYFGFIFAEGPNPESVERALRNAHAALNIVTTPLWHLN